MDFGLHTRLQTATPIAMIHIPQMHSNTHGAHFRQRCAFARITPSSPRRSGVSAAEWELCFGSSVAPCNCMGRGRGILRCEPSSSPPPHSPPHCNGSAEATHHVR